MAKTSSGFTLIELMIVVAIIGILAAVAIPKFADLITKSREAALKGSIGTVRSAIAIYYSDTDGTFPGDNLACLTGSAKYLKEIPKSLVPAKHAASSVVDDNDNLGMAAIFVADDGEWKYWNWTTPPFTGSITQGDFWVGCTHTDTKGTVWSSF